MRLFGTRFTLAAAIGVLIILVCLGGTALAPWIAPQDPNLPMGQRWEAPSVAHWLGLDQIGRDMFSRMLFAGRISIALALSAALLAFVAGAGFGFSAAISGRWWDIVLSRLADIILALPIPISALIVVAALGSSAPVLVLTIGLLNAFMAFRAARAAALTILGLDYVEAARLRGEGRMSIVWRDILPNALSALLAEFGRRFCFAFLFLAALSFLGLGAQELGPDLGSLVQESALAIPAGDAAPLYPAAVITLLAIGVNLVVDWLLSLAPPAHGGKA